MIYQWPSPYQRHVGPGQTDHVKTDLVGKDRRHFLHRFIQIVPLKEKLCFIDGSIPAPINPPQNKIPVARIDGSLERDCIADLPAVFRRKLPSGHGAFAVKQKGFLLQFVKNKFRVQGKVGGEVRHRNSGKKFFSSI